MNHGQGLHVLHAGNGFTCLGFNMALEWATGVAKWLKQHGEQSEMPNAELFGTAVGFHEYRRLMDTGSEGDCYTDCHTKRLICYYVEKRDGDARVLVRVLQLLSETHDLEADSGLCGWSDERALDAGAASDGSHEDDSRLKTNKPPR